MLWIHGFVTSQGPSQLLPKKLFLWFATTFETGFAFITGGISAAYDTNDKSLLNQLGALMLASKGVIILSLFFARKHLPVSTITTRISRFTSLSYKPKIW